MKNEHNWLSAGLDYYKLTMSQLAYEKHPDRDVTFNFVNRSQRPLTEYVNIPALQERLDSIRSDGFGAAELNYLAGDERLSSDYLSYLATAALPEIVVEDGADILIRPSGPWPGSSLWETIVMSQVNEAYYDGLLEQSDIERQDVYDEGDRRLDEKIAYFKAHPDIQFAEFGTRRRFSRDWQEHVVERLVTECPENLIGTSNVALAAEFNIPTVGTYAHELPMVYAAAADAAGGDDDAIRQSHSQVIDDMYDRYGAGLSTILPDTFTSDYFFESVRPDQLERASGLRQDSGDPGLFGRHAIAAYEAAGIDPVQKTVMFSDGLNIGTVENLRQNFAGRFQVIYGIGTDLSCDVGLPHVSNVVKAATVVLPDGRTAECIKLSDDPDKQNGPPELAARYRRIFSTD